MIIALNRYDQLAGYKWNGKFLGRFSGNIRAKSLATLPDNQILVYTQGDRLFQLKFDFLSDMNEITFT